MTIAPTKLSDTDWPALVWSIFPSLGIAAGLVALALQNASEAPIDWMACITFLVVLELVKIFVSRALEDTYLQRQDAPGAVRYFLKVMLGGLVGLAIGLSFFILKLGFQKFAAAFSDPRMVSQVFVPALVITVCAAMSLFVFRGNGLGEAARIEAQTDDTVDWFYLCVIASLLVALAIVVPAHFLESGFPIPSWMPIATRQIQHSILLLYAAAYFVGKSVLLANVYSARFKQSGRRMLAAEWLVKLLHADKNDRAPTVPVAREAKRASARRAALLLEASR